MLARLWATWTAPSIAAAISKGGSPSDCDSVCFEGLDVGRRRGPHTHLPRDPPGTMGAFCREDHAPKDGQGVMTDWDLFLDGAGTTCVQK